MSIKCAGLSTISIALTLAGCVPRQEVPRAKPSIEAGVPIELSPSDIIAVKAGVAKSLKDPDSARFGTIRAARAADGTTHVCGFVNARNSFGGFAGESPFIGILTTSLPIKIFLPAQISSGHVEAESALELCRNYGIWI